MPSSHTARRANGVSHAFTAPAMVGRDRQLHLLTTAVADPPAVVLIEGEPGIGKTRLVREFLALPDAEHHALSGGCLPYREQAPLAPVVEALRATVTPERVQELPLSGLAGALRPLLPQWASQLPPTPEPLGDPEATRHRLYRALTELIYHLNISVLVLDDAHWADSATLEFLLFLVSRLQMSPQPGAGLSAVVTYRPEDVPDKSPLRVLYSRRPHGVNQVRLSLSLLDIADTAALVSSMVGGAEISNDFASFLHGHTNGLPLAVEESMHLLGDQTDVADGWSRHPEIWSHQPEGGPPNHFANLHVPPTLRDSTLERFIRRSPAARRLLQAAAVLAEPADENILTIVAGLAHQTQSGQSLIDPTAPAAIDEAVATGLLREGSGPQRGKLTFRHALSATAVYEAIPPPRRRKLHQRAGQALARTAPPPAARLARHFRRGAQLTRWARWAEQAADEADAASDHATAAALLEQLPRITALPLTVRVRLTGKLATNALHLLTADAALTRRVIRTVRDVLGIRAVSANDRAKLRNLLGRLLNQRGEPAAAYTELARSLPRLRHDPVQAARTMILLGWPRTESWPAAVHLRWLQRAKQLVASNDSLGMQVDRATALLQLGQETGWAVADQLPNSVTTPEQRIHLARGHLNLGDSAMHWGHYQRARQLLDTALEHARTQQLELVETATLATLAYLDWLTGAWHGLAERVAGVWETTDFDAHDEDVLLVGGLLAAAQGNTTTAERLLRRSLDQAVRTGWITRAFTPAAALARLRLANGDIDAALALTSQPMSALMRKQIWVWATDLAPVRVSTLLAAGQLTASAELVTAYSAGMQNRHAPAPQAALATCQAMLLAANGQHEQAATSYLAAAQAWEQLPRPYEALRARERGAHCQLAAGNVQDGIIELERAGRGLWELGAARGADRVADALRQHGIEVSHRWRRRGYGDHLSPREREVVALVVAGKTNREIAQLLVKAPTTVAKQMRSAMRKLGVSSRTALAVQAVQRSDLASPDDEWST